LADFIPVLRVNPTFILKWRNDVPTFAMLRSEMGVKSARRARRLLFKKAAAQIVAESDVIGDERDRRGGGNANRRRCLFGRQDRGRRVRSRRGCGDEDRFGAAGTDRGVVVGIAGIGRLQVERADLVKGEANRGIGNTVGDRLRILENWRRGAGGVGVKRVGDRAIGVGSIERVGENVA
jgi:hypothetical protein